MTFLRWLTRFSELLDIPRREVCLPAAWVAFRRRLSPEDTFTAWARSGR